MQDKKKARGEKELTLGMEEHITHVLPRINYIKYVYILVAHKE